jgi:hypothetical protein
MAGSRYVEDAQSLGDLAVAQRPRCG